MEEYIKKGYKDNKIKGAMLFSLEGKARRNFRHCDEHGDLTPTEILKWMDMSYNASVDFRDLNARLCGLKQGPFEAPKDYYDRMVDIGVALREYHQDCFQPGELSRIEKECFFAGLQDQSKYLVSHMKDKKEYGPVDMLKELRENDEARYPANTTHRSGKTDGYGRNASHPDRKGVGFIARPANVEPYSDIPQDSGPDTGVLSNDPEEASDAGYYIGVINTADEMSQHLRLCFNCGRGGHYWADCTEPLKESLKLAKERVNREIRDKQDRQLNPNGGTGGKGARAPPTNFGPSQCGQGPELNSSRPTPSVYWNEDARMRWLYPANIGTAIINGQLTTVLVDSGARMNVVTPEFVKARGLEAGSIQDLNNHAGRIPINGAGGKRTEPLGYMVIQVQIQNAPSYDEDQVALIIEDPTLFSK